MAFKFVDISDLTEGELIEIIEDNTKTAAFTREEIRKLKAAAKPKMTTPTIIVDNSKKEEQPVVDSSFLDTSNVPSSINNIVSSLKQGR